MKTQKVNADHITSLEDIKYWRKITCHLTFYILCKVPILLDTGSTLIRVLTKKNFEM